MQGVDLIATAVASSQFQQMVDGVLALQIRTSDQLVDGRQSGWKLRHVHRSSCDQGNERRAPATIGREPKSQLLFELWNEPVDLPSCRSVDQRRTPEDFRELIARQNQLTPCPSLTRARDTVLPADVIEGVNSNLETALCDFPHQRRATPADVRPRQQRPVQERFDSVMLDDGGAGDLAHEAGTECPADGTPGMVRPEAEEERCLGLLPLQEIRDSRDTLTGAAVSVDVDFQDNSGHTIRAS